jgi:hypothetical protein
LTGRNIIGKTSKRPSVSSPISRPMPPPSPEQSNLTVAADGKTSKQFHQADGKPIHLLNLFVHDLHFVLAEYGQIENRLHVVRVRWWDDDRQVLFRPCLGEIGSALTDLGAVNK